MRIEDQVDHLIDNRPGRELLTPSTTTRPTRWPTASIARGDALPSYMLLTDGGRVIVNTGMGYEAPHHKRVFDAVRPGPTHYIITTQAHVDHVGGVDLFREAGTTYVAQANNQPCQDDDARIRSLRMRTAGIWFDMLGTDAAGIAAENPGVSMRQSKPVPDLTFDDCSSSTPTACASSCIAAVGETVDSCVVWLPEHLRARSATSSARSSPTSRT